MRMEVQTGPSVDIKPHAVILAGGRSSRFGCDKAQFRFGKTTMLQSLAEVLESAGFQITISTGHKSHETFEYPIIWDQEPFLGPLYALEHILKNLTANKVFLCACDTPFINPHLAKWLWNKSTNFELTLLENELGYSSMLPGVYGHRTLSAVTNNISKGEKSLKSLLRSGLKANLIQIFQWKQVDASGQSLVNINTQQDLKEVAYLLYRF